MNAPILSSLQKDFGNKRQQTEHRISCMRVNDHKAAFSTVYSTAIYATEPAIGLEPMTC